MPDFGNAERRILSYFEIGQELWWGDRSYTVVMAGKPTSSSGEPKTDIYVLTQNDDGKKEFKISYKKENADFLENKIKSERAEQIFGCKWREIIESSTRAIEEKFKKRNLIYTSKMGRTEKGAITLGWKFELLNKAGGELSGKMQLTRQQVYDVYSGINLSEDKKNSSVNGVIIENSGVADYFLMTDKVSSAQEIIEKIVPIDEYINEKPELYFACKALNYRTFSQKYDGDRPLSVQVDWHIDDGRLTADLVFDRPLMMNGNAMAERLLNCMRELGIRTTDDINSGNTDMKHVTSD